MLRKLILLAMVSLVAMACSQQGNVFSLEPGTCFNGTIGASMTDVPIVDCAEPHDNEVFAVWSVTGAELPAEDVLEQGCLDRFLSRELATDDTSGIFFGTLLPSDDSFADGDREVVCVAVLIPVRSGSLFAAVS